MIVRFRKFIKENNLYRPSETVLLSISGGIDSMVMLYLFHRSQFKISVAHCNFKLRGEDSDGDELLVREFCETNRIQFFSKRFSTKQYARNHKISIQMAAREMRRNWFNELMEEHGFACYATAHHLDDQTETFFINLFRGTGIAGIHGILPKTGKLIHPMMYTWKKEIIRYARIKRIPYRLDKSNLTSDYERNAIRNELLPAIRKINPAFDITLSQNIQLFRKAEEIYRHHVSEVTSKIILFDNEKMRIRIPDLIKLDDAQFYLFEILTEYNFNKSVVADIYRSLSSESGRIFNSSTHRLIIDRDQLILQKKPDEDQDYGIFEIQKTDGQLTEPLLLKIKQYTRTADTVLFSEPDTAKLDAAKLKFPLQVRKWVRGDSFYPLGMENRKLLSDYFIDNKFSIFQKEQTWLLLSNNKIVWLIGHRIDDRFKITDSTKNIIEIKVKS